VTGREQVAGKDGWRPKRERRAPLDDSRATRSSGERRARPALEMFYPPAATTDHWHTGLRYRPAAAALRLHHDGNRDFLAVVSVAQGELT